MSYIVKLHSIVVILSIIFSSLGTFLFEDAKRDIFGILFGVSSTMFSVGLSLIVTFSYPEVTDKDLRSIIKTKIDLVKNRFFLIYFFCVLYYLLSCLISSQSIFIYRKISFNSDVFVLLMFIFSIVFFISNFLMLQKLRADLENAEINFRK